jgi:hypothetical protein
VALVPVFVVLAFFLFASNSEARTDTNVRAHSVVPTATSDLLIIIHGVGLGDNESDCGDFGKSFLPQESSGFGLATTGNTTTSSSGGCTLTLSCTGCRASLENDLVLSFPLNVQHLQIGVVHTNAQDDSKSLIPLVPSSLLLLSPLS